MSRHHRPGVFLDRDGTLVEDPGYLGDPGRLRLLPGAGEAVRLLNRAGLAAVVVTNQSGIARGLYSLDDYFATERRLTELLVAEGARLEAQLFCPHHPDFTGACECRKPGTQLFRQAAEQLDLDMTNSWWVGNQLRDLAPSRGFGGKGILVAPDPDGAEARDARHQGYRVCSDILSAVRFLLQQTPARGEA